MADRLRVLIEAGHYPASGGAPGEAAWTWQLGTALAARLRQQGVEVALVGSWYPGSPSSPPPPEVRRDYDVFVSLHYDAAIYGPGHNTGAFADRAASDPMAAESDQAILAWEAVYFPATGLRNAKERRNPNTWHYYGFRDTTAKTPGMLIEHGVGAPVGTGGYPPGDDAALLHGRLDLIAALDARAILDYLGVTTSVSEVLPISLPIEEGTNVAMLTDEQTVAVATALWDARGVVFNPASAIGRGWLTRWRAGAYAGPPMGAEVTLPDGVVVQEFGNGLAVWVPGAAEASWDG